MKVIDRLKLISANPLLEGYVKQEIDTMMNLNMINIVKFIEFKENKMAFFIVMEYCEDNLHHFIFKKHKIGMPEDLAKDLFL
jgi:hypothetical protein